MLINLLNDSTHPMRHYFNSRCKNRVEEFDSLKQIQTVRKFRFYPLFWQSFTEKNLKLSSLARVLKTDPKHTRH